MSKCSKCPYATEVTRTFGVTKHCNLAASQMDVTYYCSPKHSDEENMLCPFVNEHTRFPGVDYGKYETDEID